MYVRSFEELLAGPVGRWQVSVGGVGTPIWSKNGRELFYLAPDGRIIRVEYAIREKTFIPGKPVPWSETKLVDVGFTNLERAPDGRHFAMFLGPESATPPASVRVTFLLNLFDELRRHDARR